MSEYKIIKGLYLTRPYSISATTLKNVTYQKNLMDYFHVS